MLNSAWIRARKVTNLDQVRVHDIKHTFGRRLRSAGVSFEDRQDLLGHRSGRITTHYSAAELSRLLKAANIVCHRNSNSGKSEIVFCAESNAPGQDADTGIFNPFGNFSSQSNQKLTASSQQPNARQCLTTFNSSPQKLRKYSISDGVSISQLNYIKYRIFVPRM